MDMQPEFGSYDPDRLTVLHEHKVFGADAVGVGGDSRGRAVVAVLGGERRGQAEERAVAMTPRQALALGYDLVEMASHTAMDH